MADRAAARPVNQPITAERAASFTPLRLTEAKAAKIEGASLTLKNARELPESLRQFRDKEGADAATTLRRTSETRSLSQEDRTLLETKVGPDGKTPPIIQEALQFADYADVQRNIRNGMSEENAIKAVYGSERAKYDTARRSVLQRMTNLDIIRQLPGFRELKTEGAQQDFVEAYFAEQPDMRNAVLESLKSAAQKAAAIPEVEPIQKPQSPKDRLKNEILRTEGTLRSLKDSKSKEPAILIRVAELEGQLLSLKSQEKSNTTPDAISSQLTPDQQKLAADRQKAQTEIAHELEETMSKSIERVILERRNDAVALQDRKMEADAREADKAGRTDEARAIRKVKEGAKKWIHEEPRKDGSKKKDTITEYQRIGEDAHVLAGQGEDGVRRLVLRELTSGKDAVIKLEGVQTADGKPVDWRSVQFDQLSEENRALLEKVYKQEGGTYSQRLLEDYASAIHPKNQRERVALKASKGALDLTDRELSSLYHDFGEKLKQGFEYARNIGNIRQTLENEGVDIKSKMGIIFMLLALIGGVFPKNKEYAQQANMPATA